MASIYVRTFDDGGSEVTGSGLRTGSAAEAVAHALKLKSRYPEPTYTTKILYSGSFVDPAFADLTQLAQQHDLTLDPGFT